MAQQTAQIIDLNAFRKSVATQPAALQPSYYAPMLVWVPVWVLVPQQ